MIKGRGRNNLFVWTKRKGPCMFVAKSEDSEYGRHNTTFNSETKIKRTTKMLSNLDGSEEETRKATKSIMITLGILAMIAAGTIFGMGLLLGTEIRCIGVITSIPLGVYTMMMVVVPHEKTSWGR